MGRVVHTGKKATYVGGKVFPPGQYTFHTESVGVGRWLGPAECARLVRNELLGVGIRGAVGGTDGFFVLIGWGRVRVV